MNEVDDILLAIWDCEHEGYIDYSFECKLDNLIKRLVQIYFISDISTREYIRNNLDEGNGQTLQCYAARMAIFAVRKKTPELIRDALKALVVENNRYDDREALIKLSTIYDSALRTGAPFEKICNELSRDATDKYALFLRHFNDRSEDTKSLEVFWMEAIGTGDTFTYRQKMRTYQ